MNKMTSLLGAGLLAFSLSGCLGPDPAIVAVDSFIKSQLIDKSDPRWKTKLPKPEIIEFTSDKKYLWDLQTNKGNLTIKLMPSVAPMHVTSTIYLTRLGFYDDLIFHRVIPQFMAQGGDPLGNGRGNPGYRYAGEYDDSVSHDRPGLLSMANAGPGTDGSQFFITFKPTPFLDGKHTIFGEVISGQEDTLKTLESLGSPRGQTREPLMIIKAGIRVES